jgi:hypothetical protein
MMKRGDYFRVDHRGYEHHGQVVICRAVKSSLKVKGNRDYPALDLGEMVEFVVDDYHDKPTRHAIPIEWCKPCPRPSMAKRVK